MTVSQIMDSLGTANIIDIILVCEPTTGVTFDAHRFIRAFRAKYEVEYIQMLINHVPSSTGAFQQVNAEISSWLNRNITKINTVSQTLGSTTPDKVNSLNDHGIISLNQQWIRI